MLHILTIVGARPQFIKASALSRTIRTQFSDSIRETLVHTGQHYDANMSQVFFDELGMPEPAENLGIGSVSPAAQIAGMIAGLDKILLREKPGAVVVYGDTNSTLAGALAANKASVPVVHIEAGLRSFNRDMPEEVNRVLTDRLSTLLFSPTKTALRNLVSENIAPEIPAKASVEHPAAFHCGDIMFDNHLYFEKRLTGKIMEREKLRAGEYFVATVHRDFNTDNVPRLLGIFSALEQLAKKYAMPVIVPLHPRTQARVDWLNFEMNPQEVRMMPPVSFLEMMELEKNAKLILTDSGGVQKEAFFARKPCVILRPETEWVELVECGASVTAGTDTTQIEAAVEKLMHAEISFPPIFGDGHAAGFMCRQMLHHLS